MNYLPDSAGRVQTVQNAASGLNYAQLSYTAAGDISSMTMGNSVVESVTWNDRLQPVVIQAGSQLTLGLFPCAGFVTVCSSGNNGNVQAQRITIPGLTVTQSYTYDSVNRLLGASESGGSSSWSESYLYDDGNGHQTANRYVNPNPGVRTGLPNLTNETPTGPAWFGSNNRIANNWVTDPAGNIQSVGGMSRSFTWDAEDRQTSATTNGVTYTYLYDGLGQRVQKSGNGATTTFVYDADGNLAAEYQIAGQLAPPCATATCYVTVDHLGSTRMITDSSGNVAARYDYLPFGTELQAGTGGRLASMGYTLMPDGFLLKFTGQARDQETGLDYMNARMYSPAEGRFTGADPGNAGAYMGNGQSWNGYAYVGNNPLSLTDPSGMVTCVSCVADESGNPVVIGAAAAIDIGAALGGLFEGIFGGGSHPPAYANFSFPDEAPTFSVTGVGSTSDSGLLSTDLAGDLVALGLGFQSSGPQPPRGYTACSAVPFVITGVGPLPQAPGDGAFVGRPPRAGEVAIEPRNFGIPYDTLAQREAAQSRPIASVVRRIRIYPNFGTNTAPLPKGTLKVPRGLPSGGPYSPADTISPRPSGNAIDLYRYGSMRNARASTRITMPTIFIPINNVGVRCPQ